jgi:hypothetical protein
MEWKEVLLHVTYSACIEPKKQYPYYGYYTEYEKVLYEEKDITELVSKYRYIAIAIREELSYEYPKTGENLHTSIWLYLPIEFVEEIQKFEAINDQ